MFIQSRAPPQLSGPRTMYLLDHALIGPVRRLELRENITGYMLRIYQKTKQCYTTILRRPEPIKVRIEPTTLRVTAT